MPTGTATIGKYDRYLKQRRALGYSSPSQSDRAAFLQGDLAARAALADRASDRQQQKELENRRMNIMQSHYNQQNALQREAVSRQADYMKFKGAGDLLKLGIQAWPQIRSGYGWMRDQFAGSPADDYQLGDFSFGGGMGGTFGPQFGYSHDYNLGNFGGADQQMFGSPSMFEQGGMFTNTTPFTSGLNFWGE